MVKLGDWISEGFNMLKEQFWAWIVVMLVYFVVSMLIFTCVGYFVIIGVLIFGPHAVALRQLRGERVEVGDLFAPFSLILPALGFTAIMLLITLPSLLLAGLPLIFIMPLFMFVPHLVTDRGMGVIDAMKASYGVVKQDYWWFLLTNIVVGFIANIGSYACSIGVIATLPLLYTILAVAYRDCFDVEDAVSFKSEDMQPEAMQ
jgi:uncharacterized membrane protein